MRCVLIISKMQDISNVLLIIQASLMGVSLTLFFALVLSSLQKTDTTKAYEIVRWLLAFAMLLFAVHYIMQMVFGFRAQGDDVGAVINILFYSAIAYILSVVAITIIENSGLCLLLVRCLYSALLLEAICIMVACT